MNEILVVGNGGLRRGDGGFINRHPNVAMLSYGPMIYPGIKYDAYVHNASRFDDYCVYAAGKPTFVSRPCEPSSTLPAVSSPQVVGKLRKLSPSAEVMPPALYEDLWRECVFRPMVLTSGLSFSYWMKRKGLRVRVIGFPDRNEEAPAGYPSPQELPFFHQLIPEQDWNPCTL